MNDAPSIAFIRGRSPVGRLEGSLTVLTFFFLTYSLPMDWFRLPGATEDGQRVFQGNTAAFIAVFGGLVALQLGRFIAQPELIVWVFRYSPLAVVFVVLSLAVVFRDRVEPRLRSVSTSLADKFVALNEMVVPAKPDPQPDPQVPGPQPDPPVATALALDDPDCGKVAQQFRPLTDQGLTLNDRVDFFKDLRIHSVDRVELLSRNIDEIHLGRTVRL